MIAFLIERIRYSRFGRNLIHEQVLYLFIIYLFAVVFLLFVEWWGGYVEAWLVLESHADDVKQMTRSLVTNCCSLFYFEFLLKTLFLSSSFFLSPIFLTFTSLLAAAAVAAVAVVVDYCDQRFNG